MRIDRLGLEGDGVARGPGAPLHVRGALPGETVVARPDGRFLRAGSVLAASPDRVSPPCPLFNSCGGCVVQHLAPAAALSWKRGMVTDALRNAGFPLPDRIRSVQVEPGTRRRMDLALRRGPEGVVVGLNARGTTMPVPMTTCHVLHPVLLELVLALPAMLNRVQGLHQSGSASVNLLDSGPDLLLATTAPLTPRDRALLADFARAHAIPRICATRENDRNGIELVSLLAPVSHRLGDVPVTPPPGGFLQATEAGERAILDAVRSALPPTLPRGARIVELYAGCGTIGLPLSAQRRIAAFEGSEAACTSLRAAAGGRRIEVGHRDLNRQPLLASELAGSAAIILDPPHAGGGAQAREIANANVPLIIYVSCNPTALAQDARLLAASNYRLDAVTVIDQFLWSARTESVCVFSKPATVRRGPMPRPPRR